MQAANCLLMLISPFLLKWPQSITFALACTEESMMLLFCFVPKFLSDIVHIACKTYPGEFLAHGWGPLIGHSVFNNVPDVTCPVIQSGID